MPEVLHTRPNLSPPLRRSRAERAHDQQEAAADSFDERHQLQPAESPQSDSPKLGDIFKLKFRKDQNRGGVYVKRDK